MRITHHIFSERHKGSHNVIVNDNLEYQFDAQGILERLLINYHRKSRAGLVSYAVVVFREVILVNMEDRGYQLGLANFIRSVNSVLVFKSCLPGIAYKHVP